MPAISNTIARAIATRLQAADYTDNPAARQLANELLLLDLGAANSQVSPATLCLLADIELCARSIDLALKDLERTKGADHASI